MDYKKKYKDLVKAVKELQEANPSDEGIQNWVNENVPELKESEDERIRKELLHLISYIDITEENRKRYIAWFENRKPIKWENDDCATLENWIVYVEENKDKWELCDWFVDATKDVVRKIKYVLSNNQELLDESFSEENRDYWLEKKGERKIPKFKTGDFIQYKGMGHNRYTINEVCGTTHYINSQGKRMDMSYTDANFELVEQKPIKWSEEDEDVMNTLIKYLTQECDKTPIPEDKEMFEREISMLKSLKDRVGCEVNCTTTKEWSEEDKKMSRFIGNAITADGASEYLESKGIQVIDAHVWLDKLKDRVQPQNTWKPSEADILLLERMANGKSNPQDFQASLYALIGQLKKLMEE